MSATLDMTAVKDRMKATWESGNDADFAIYMEPGAVDLLHAWGVEPGQRFLDVGCGAGQLAIPAARTGVDVTGVDIAENLVRAARDRAAAERLPARFDQGDAEALPYADASFDVVASLFGAMFAPRPERVAAELMRVCRPGGRILMGNWTRDSFPAHMFRNRRCLRPAPGCPGADPVGGRVRRPRALRGRRRGQDRKALLREMGLPLPGERRRGLLRPTFRADRAS